MSSLGRTILSTAKEHGNGPKPLGYSKPQRMPTNILLNPIELPPMRRIQGLSDEEYEALENERERGECGFCDWQGPWRADAELAIEDAKAHGYTEHPEHYSRA